MQLKLLYNNSLNWWVIPEHISGGGTLFAASATSQECKEATLNASLIISVSVCVVFKLLTVFKEQGESKHTVCLLENVFSPSLVTQSPAGFCHHTVIYMHLSRRV